MISVIYTDENERELAEFLTRSLEGLDIERFEWMALAADIGRGEVLTGYYKSGVQDKLLAALHIMSDGLYGIVDANFDRLMRDHGYDAPDESGEDEDVFLPQGPRGGPFCESIYFITIRARARFQRFVRA